MVFVLICLVDGLIEIVNVSRRGGIVLFMEMMVSLFPYFICRIVRDVCDSINPWDSTFGLWVMYFVFI